MSEILFMLMEEVSSNKIIFYSLKYLKKLMKKDGNH